MPPYPYPPRRPVALAQTIDRTGKADLQQGPLSLARTATGEQPAAQPMGVSVAAAPIPPTNEMTGEGRVGNGAGHVRDPLDAFYGEQLSALQQGVLGLPQKMDSYRDQRNASLDQQEALYRDHINGLQPERSQQLGRFAAALLAPTRSGSFFEGFGNATNAALDQRSIEAKQRAALEEKKFLAANALAKLQADRNEDPMAALDQRVKYLQTANDVNDLQGDFQLQQALANGLTPNTPEALVADARKNPKKYASPRGQQLVADAQEKMAATAKTADERAWWLQQQEIQSRLKREEEAAKAAAEGTKPTPLDRAEANRVAKRLAEVQTSASEASQLKNDIAALRSSRDQTGMEGMWFGDTYANLGQWVGAPGASELAQVRGNAENLRLSLTSKLKGAISDNDMKLLGNATPGIGMADNAASNILDAQEAAAQRGIERSMFLQRWVQANGSDYGADEAWAVYTEQNPLFSQSKDGTLQLNKMNVGNWREYVTGPDGRATNGGVPQGAGGGAGGAGGSQPQGLLVDPNALPPKIRAWAEKQLRDGIPPEQVIQRINDHVLNKTGGQQ